MRKTTINLLDVATWLKGAKILGQFYFNEGESEIDGEPIDRIILTTRANGIRDDRGDTYGEVDMRAAIVLARLIRAQYPTLDVEVNTCDEWVNVDITRS